MKRETIPRKYRRAKFADFILNITDLGRDFMPIRGGGSLEEYAYYFGLLDFDETTIEEILRFLRNRGCIEVRRKENLIRLHHENLQSLHSMLERRARK